MNPWDGGPAQTAFVHQQQQRGHKEAVRHDRAAKLDQAVAALGEFLSGDEFLPAFYLLRATGESVLVFGEKGKRCLVLTAEGLQVTSPEMKKPQLATPNVLREVWHHYCRPENLKQGEVSPSMDILRDLIPNIRKQLDAIAEGGVKSLYEI